MYKTIDKSRCQLVAHCFFSKATGKVELTKYNKYYEQQ